MGGYIEKALPLVQHSPASAPLVATLLKFGVTGFKVGKTIEGAFDQAIDRLTKEATATAGQPKPDPEMERIKADQEVMQLRLQAEQQSNAAKRQFEQQKGQMEMAMERQRMQMEFRMEAMQSQQEQAFERFEALLKAKTAIDVAQISAEASVKAAENRPKPEAAN